VNLSRAACAPARRSSRFNARVLAAGALVLTLACALCARGLDASAPPVVPNPVARQVALEQVPVAIPVFRVEIFRRSEGHNIINKAAYRSGTAIYDARLGVTHDYTRKLHVDDTGILAPPDAPSWVFDRAKLWNTVDRVESRRDAQLARALEPVGLPRELTADQQKELLESFLHEHFVSRGMIADYAIHRAPGNPHAHVLLTMRDIGQECFGLKRRDWDDKGLVVHWRAAWELDANRALANAGRHERIDMRSYAARGIEIEPQPKLGRSRGVAHLDGRDHVHEQAIEAHHVARRNGERIAARPEVVLELLTSRQSCFTERELLRALHRCTADADQFSRVRTVVEQCPELVELPGALHGRRRFSTQTVVRRERALLVSAHVLAQRAGHFVPPGRAQRALDATKRTLTEEQAAAFEHATRAGDLVLIEGYAGTGKSTLLEAARRAWSDAGYVVVGGALAGKAAEGLADPDGAGIPSRTLASWQWAWAQRKDLLTHRHVLVIDEAGMVGTRELEAVLAQARDAGAKVVLVGDTQQLQAIEPGAPLRVLQERYGAARLKQVLRQGAHEWQAAATLDFGEGRPAIALKAYVAQGRVHAHHSAEEAQAALVAAWNARRLEAPAESTILLAYRRKDVRALNERVRAMRQAAGELGADHHVDTAQGTRAFAVGDRIYFLKNDRVLGVTNGTLATIEQIEGSQFTVRLDDHRQLSFDSMAYAALDHGYAATIHKSQGVTVDRTYVLASRYMDAAATYVALSRHRADGHLFYATPEFPTEEALIKRLSRRRENRMALETSAPLPSAERLDQRLRAEEAFLTLSPAGQLERIEALRVLAQRVPRSAAEIFELFPEVKSAAAARDRAAASLSVTTRDFDQFCQEHRIATELRSASYREQVAAVERAQKELVRAEQALDAIRRDPARRARAEAFASRHNISIRRAHERLGWCNDLRARQERDRAIGRYAEAANAKQGAERFRVATCDDEGRTFEVLARREVRGEPVFLLRESRKAPLVFADARLFAEPPVVGERAVLTGRGLNLSKEKGRDHDGHSRSH
jgi:Ti-type conjugative transfer relaxase TraA